MEANGPANIKMVLQMMQMDIDECGHVTTGDMEKYMKSLNEQVDLTIGYMKEIAKHIKTLGDIASCSDQDYKENVHKIPLWHEFKAEVKNDSN